MIYSIKKGKHYFWPLFDCTVSIIPKNFKRTLVFAVTFNDTCCYDLHDEVEQFDCNKLFGHSEGKHHTSSVRAGWYFNTSDGKIHICYYAYENGEKLENGLYKDLYAVELNTQYVIEITTERDQLDLNYVWDTIKIFDQSGRNLLERYTHRRYVKYTWHLGYYLLPYFGGNHVAPHNMNLEVVRIKKEVINLNKKK